MQNGRAVSVYAQTWSGTKTAQGMPRIPLVDPMMLIETSNASVRCEHFERFGPAKNPLCSCFAPALATSESGSRVSSSKAPCSDPRVLPPRKRVSNSQKSFYMKRANMKTSLTNSKGRERIFLSWSREGHNPVPAVYESTPFHCPWEETPLHHRPFSSIQNEHPVCHSHGACRSRPGRRWS